MTIASIIGRSTAVLLAAASLCGMAHARETSPATATSAPTTADVAVASPAKRYCVASTQITGTRLAMKTCRTRADWLKQGFDPLDPK